jgi:hypothetical protein
MNMTRIAGSIALIFPDLEQRHRLGAAADRLDIITDTLQRPLQIFAHRRIVFGQKDPDHRFYSMRVRLKIFQRLAALARLLSAFGTVRL